MQDKDTDMDGILEDNERLVERATSYAENLSTQLRKGLLSYCVLLVCRKTVYTSEIIRELRTSEVVVAEGTIYPLLARLQKDGLLSHKWQESEQGPPRKYYEITDYGWVVCEKLAEGIAMFNQSISKLEGSKNE